MLAILAAVIPASAFNAEIRPLNVAPGDLFAIRVHGSDAEGAYADFQKKRIPLYRTGDAILTGLAPVDISTKAGTYEVRIKAGGQEKIVSLRVVSHTFRTISLTLPKGKVTPGPEDSRRVEKEYLLQQKIWKVATGPMWNGRFERPLDTEVSTEFGVRRVMNKEKVSIHHGMDFRGRAGKPVSAVNSGRVVLANELFYGGNTIVVDHGMGLYSVYMHLSEFKTKRGAIVAKGQVVGLVGSTGRATGPHLHLSVKLRGVSVNPESLFQLDLTR